MHWRLNLMQVCYILDVSEKVLSLIRFVNEPEQVHLRDSEHSWKRMDQGKTQCWALFFNL